LKAYTSPIFHVGTAAADSAHDIGVLYGRSRHQNTEPIVDRLASSIPNYESLVTRCNELKATKWETMPKTERAEFSFLRNKLLPIKACCLSNPPFFPCQRTACTKTIVLHWGRDCPNPTSPFKNIKIRLVEVVGEDPPILMVTIVDNPSEEFFVHLDSDGVNFYYQRIDTMPLPLLGDSMSDLFFANTKNDMLDVGNRMDKHFVFHSKINPTPCPKNYTDEAFSAVSPPLLHQVFVLRKLFPTTVLSSNNTNFPEHVTHIYGKTLDRTSNPKWSGPAPFAVSWNKESEIYFIHSPIATLDAFLHKIRSSNTPG
jgi:hypothetical protein